MNNNNYYTQSENQDIGLVFTNAMSAVYFYMFLGLLVTAIIAFLTSTNDAFMERLLGTPNLFYGLIIGELLLVMALSFFVRRMPFILSFLLFNVYSLVNGLTLSVIFRIYTSASVYSAFLVTCLTFGAMSAIGFFTKKDLTTLGHYLIMGLIGIIIAGIVNLFIMNDSFSFLVTVLGLLIFIGLTAYDTQKIKRRVEEERYSININKIAIWGALSLYLDFINIFLRILRLSGRRR